MDLGESDYVSIEIFIKINNDSGKPVMPKDWPKKDNIAASWALNGNKAVQHPNPVLHMSVITLENAVADFALRDVDVRNGSLKYENLIETSELLDNVETVNERLPAGALSPGPARGPRIQITWNAHIRVRK